jgi:predicted anti-sigma-YlaC factor YlaD
MCREAKEHLQDLMDNGHAANPLLEDHLSGCESCRRFREFLRGLAAEVTDAIDAAAADMPTPDISAILRRGDAAQERVVVFARRARFAIGSIAAVLVACAGIGAGVLSYGARPDRAVVAANVESFVEDMFAESLFAGTELSALDTVSDVRTWLEEPGTRTLP